MEVEEEEDEEEEKEKEETRKYTINVDIHKAVHIYWTYN